MWVALCITVQAVGLMITQMPAQYTKRDCRKPSPKWTIAQQKKMSLLPLVSSLNQPLLLMQASQHQRISRSATKTSTDATSRLGIMTLKRLEASLHERMLTDACSSSPRLVTCHMNKFCDESAVECIHNRRIVNSCHLVLAYFKANHLLSHFIGELNPHTRDDSECHYLVIAFSRGRFIRG
ncbi:hypothetical protein BDR07DRAFT_496792 [Suillus spraguei]|nr:hypothetical protein BDR07DRAFT_496792 [Suillus spraguei]